MSLPVWFHVSSRGYDVSSCLVSSSFQEVCGPRGYVVPGVSSPRVGLVSVGIALTSL